MTTSQYLLNIHTRQTLHESFYVEHQHSTVRLLIACLEDFDVLRRYVKEQCPNLPINDSQLDQSLRTSIEQSLTIMATDCFDVCGLICGHQLIQTGHSTQETLNGYADKGVKIDLLSVRGDYRRARVGTKLMKEMLRLVQKSQVQHVCLEADNELIVKIGETFKATTKQAPTNGSTHPRQLHFDLHSISDLLLDDPPTLPKAYQLKEGVERRQLGEYYAKALGRPLHYVIASEEDESLVKDFLINEYFRQTTVPRTLQCQRSDGAELITRFRSELLGQGLVFLAHDQGRVCGLAVNKIVKIDRSGPLLDDRIPEDFSNEIDKQTLSHLGGRAIRALVAWMDSLTPQSMPKPYESYYLLDMLTVQPSYRGCKIGWKLWYESLKHSQQLGFYYTQTICTAVASNRLATGFGMVKKIEFPYDQLKYKGKMLFEEGVAYDGGKKICLYIGETDQLKLDV